MRKMSLNFGIFLHSRKKLRILKQNRVRFFCICSDEKKYLSASANLSFSKRASSNRSSSALLKASNLSCSAISAKRASSSAFIKANLAASAASSNLFCSASIANLFSSCILKKIILLILFTPRKKN